VARNQISVDVKQPPGPRNALGLLKIEFPNKHAIYMHDTPEKSLFNHAQRAFSHGCVRLKYPREMAAALLGKPVSYIDQRIAEGVNASENVPGDIPVYLAYFTAWPDQTGTVHYYGDVYGRDGHLSDALAKTEAARKAG
jgi:murein L,D-transpeptidase YcbB/YkuD